MLEFIWTKVLFMSLVMTVSGSLVFCITRLCGKWLSKGEIKRMWLVPLLLALIPVSGIPDFFAQPALQPGEPVAYVAPQVVQEPAAVKEQEPAKPLAETAQPKQFVQTAVHKLEAEKLPLKTVGVALYFGAVLVLLLLQGVRSVRFRQLLKKATKPASCALLEQCKAELKMRRKVRLYTVNFDCSPFACGLIRPKIVFPAGDIAKETLMHELSHIKHGDLWYILLLQAVKIMHFFNPAIYFFAQEIKNGIELACDEFCAVNMNESERICYSKKLIAVSAPAPKGVACLSENGKKMKERVEVIMHVRKKSVISKSVAIVLSVVMLLGQTALAAAINGSAPVKAYIVNNASVVNNIAFADGEHSYYSHNNNANLQKNRASLVNTEFYKGFSADLYPKMTDMLNRENPETDMEIHVTMDKFLKSVDGGKHWQGLFTVIVNGTVVLSGAKGYMNYVPGNYDRCPATLYVAEGETVFRIGYMNFDLDAESQVNAEYAEEQAQLFEPTVTRYLRINMTEAFNQKDAEGQKDKEFNVLARIKYNPETGDLHFFKIPLPGNYSFCSIPGEKYVFSGDTASGNFYLYKAETVIADKFAGVLSGLSTDTITFKSLDRDVAATFTAREEEDAWTDYGRYGQVYGTPFEENMEQNQYRRRISDMPFTLELNEDKTKIIMRIKEGFAPERYYWSYASYIGENDVYNKGNSDGGQREFELEISPSYGVHNLQFAYYNTTPYVQKNDIDILFRIVNGEIIYHNCAENVMINKSYSGEEGLKELEFYIRG